MIVHYMKVQPIVRELYFKRMKLLSEDDEEFTAVHIRNTDRTANVDEFLENSRTILDAAKKIFLATDDFYTIEKFRGKYEEKMYHFAKITDNGGRNMHYYHDKSQLSNEDLVKDAIVDLLMLASSTKFIYSTTHSNYSKFAGYLQKSKESLGQILK